MSLPHTLAGIVGLVIFLSFMSIYIIPNTSQNIDTISSASLELQNNFNASVNSTSTGGTGGFWSFLGDVTGLNGVYDFIIGFFSMIINTIRMTFVYLGIFNEAFSQMPTALLFVPLILLAFLLIGIIKLVALSGD